MFNRLTVLSIALLLGISSISSLAAAPAAIAKPASQRGITTEQWEKIKVGMTQQQVIKICGEPKKPRHKGPRSWLYWLGDRMVGIKWENNRVVSKGELAG